MQDTSPEPDDSLVREFVEGGYSAPIGTTADYLHGGPNGAIGFSVAPVKGSPVDFRFDFAYNRMDGTPRLIALSQAAASGVNKVHEDIWSGSLDLEFRAQLGGGVQGYLMGGGGAYRTHLALRRPGLGSGGTYGGGSGFGEQTVATYTMTKFGWNAGAGLSFPLEDGGAWFIEARFTRIPASGSVAPLQFVPIDFGVQF
jgi:opacity protein-like surface antigen